MNLGQEIGVVIEHWVGDEITWGRYQDRDLNQNTLIVTLMNTSLDDIQNHKDWDYIAPQLIRTLSEPARAA